MPARIRKKKWNASRFYSSSTRQRPPHRRRFCRTRIPIPQQQLQLVCLQATDILIGGVGPPAKAFVRKPLLAQPKPLPVIDQQFERTAAPVPEDEQRTLQGIAQKDLATQAHQPVDTLAKVRRLYREQNPHVRSDLDHRGCLQKASARARSAEPWSANCTVILPPGSSDNSTVQLFPQNTGNGGGTTSRNLDG